MASGPFTAAGQLGSNMMCMGVPALNYAYMNMMRNPNSALAHLAENQVNPNLETQIRNHIGENSLISVLHTPDGKIFRCNLCAKSFSVWTELEIHLRTHAGEGGTGHMTQVFSEEGETTFGCNLCEKKFKVWGHLQAHIRSHTNSNKDKGHPNMQNHANIQNQNQNQNQNQELQNIGEQRDNGQPKCQNEQKNNINIMTNGENILQKLSIFMCNICTKTFKTREQLQEHGKTHNPNIDVRKIEVTCMNSTNDPMDITFDCNLCARTFSARELFQDHMKGHANDRAALYMMYTPDKECPYKCNFCGETFKVMMNLQNHIKTHMLNTNLTNSTTKIKTEKQFKCTECKKSYDVWGHLQAHMKKHTGESKSAAQLVEGQIPFKCEICDKIFSAKAHLMGHMKSHGDPAVCDICGKEFMSQNHLQRHRIIHTGERPHKCDICGMKFIRKEHLKRHVMTHLADKSVMCGCDMCGKFFSRPEHLRRHYRMHTGERPFKCDLCEKEYSRKDRLQHHMRSHEKEVRDVLMNNAFSMNEMVGQTMKRASSGGEGQSSSNSSISSQSSTGEVNTNNTQTAYPQVSSAQTFSHSPDLTSMNQAVMPNNNQNHNHNNNATPNNTSEQQSHADLAAACSSPALAQAPIITAEQAVRLSQSISVPNCSQAQMMNAIKIPSVCSSPAPTVTLQTIGQGFVGQTLGLATLHDRQHMLGQPSLDGSIAQGQMLNMLRQTHTPVSHYGNTC